MSRKKCSKHSGPADEAVQVQRHVDFLDRVSQEVKIGRNHNVTVKRRPGKRSILDIRYSRGREQVLKLRLNGRRPGPLIAALARHENRHLRQDILGAAGAR